jgi:hypothetical protein
MRLLAVNPREIATRTAPSATATTPTAAPQKQMDETIRALLMDVLPNVPDALAEEWLAPYVRELGAPQSYGRWLYILAGRPLDFWRNVSWDLERVDLVTLVQSKLTSSCNRTLTEMETAYFEGTPNPYSQQIPDGRERTLQAITFLQTHHVFPCPPAFLCLPNGMMEIIDGNHRMLAFVRAMKMHPPAANPVQSIWLGRSPDVP